MRLTKKVNKEWKYEYSRTEYRDERLPNPCVHLYLGDIDFVQKLGQLEDIEDELGIDLITLFKALKQEVLFVKTNIDIKETVKSGDGWGFKDLSFEEGEIVIFAQVLYPNNITHKEWLTPLRLKLSDYGKTWALTKEELL